MVEEEKGKRPRRRGRKRKTKEVGRPPLKSP
jgi:hypothetical protein